jgi:hypothetical protein
MAIATHGPGPTSIKTEFWFLERTERHDEEKPYKLRYDPGPHTSRTNCTNVRVEDITVSNIRGHEHKFTMETDGFAIAHLDSKLLPGEFDDEEKVKEVYYAELREFLGKKFGAKRVEVLEHGVCSSNLSSGS